MKKLHSDAAFAPEAEPGARACTWTVYWGLIPGSRNKELAEHSWSGDRANTRCITIATAVANWGSILLGPSGEPCGTCFRMVSPQLERGALPRQLHSHFYMCEYRTACWRPPRCVVQLRHGAVGSRAGCWSNGWRKTWAGGGGAAKMYNATVIFSFY